jgi:hypothetical protein
MVIGWRRGPCGVFCRSIILFWLLTVYCIIHLDCNTTGMSHLKVYFPSLPKVTMSPQITLLFIGQQPPVGHGLLVIKASRSQTPHSARFLWTSDQLVAQTSTYQHTILTRDRHPCASGIRTRNPSNLEAADPRPSPRALALWVSA